MSSDLYTMMAMLETELQDTKTKLAEAEARVKELTDHPLRGMWPLPPPVCTGTGWAPKNGIYGTLQSHGQCGICGQVIALDSWGRTTTHPYMLSTYPADQVSVSCSSTVSVPVSVPVVKAQE